MTPVERLMKQCQVGFGGRNALADANDCLADCYGTLGRLKMERDRLLVLAIKHCDREHHDWAKIMAMEPEA